MPAIELIPDIDYINSVSAASLLGVSYPWFLKLLERDELVYYTTPLGRVFKRSDVEAYIQKRLSAGTGPGRPRKLSI